MARPGRVDLEQFAQAQHHVVEACAHGGGRGTAEQVLDDGAAGHDGAGVAREQLQQLGLGRGQFDTLAVVAGGQHGAEIDGVATECQHVAAGCRCRATAQEGLDAQQQN